MMSATAYGESGPRLKRRQQDTENGRLTWLESRRMRDRGGVATKCAVELRLSRGSKTQIGETQWPHVHFERLPEALARYLSGRYEASDHGGREGPFLRLTENRPQSRSVYVDGIAEDAVCSSSDRGMILCSLYSRNASVSNRGRRYANDSDCLGIRVNASRCTSSRLIFAVSVVRMHRFCHSRIY